MTPRIRHIALFAGIALLLSVAPARAQITGPVKFTTTFAFTVGNTSLPAGTYTIAPDSDNLGVFEIVGTQARAFFEVENRKAPTAASATEIVFARYGTAFLLKNVWVEGSTEGIETAIAEAERHHRKAGKSTGEARVKAIK